MTTSFQYSLNNIPLNHRAKIVEDKIFVKTRNNTISITDFQWKIMV